MADSPSPPPSVDYGKLIPLQTENNVWQFNKALDASRIDSYGPAGYQEWFKNPITGRMEQHMQLSQDQQEIFDRQEDLSKQSLGMAGGMLGRIQQMYGKDANFADFVPEFQKQAAPTYKGPSYDANTASKVSDALYGQHTRFLDPQFGRKRADLRDDLVAQGFSTQGDAFKKSNTQLDEAEEQAYGQARLAAITGGQDAAGKELQNALASSGADFNAQLASGNFGTQQQLHSMQSGLARIGQMERDRARGLSEFNAFRNGGQGTMPNGPTTQTPPQALQGVDMLGAANAQYGNQLGLYNSQAASASNMNSGLMGLGTTAAMAMMFMSDRKLKTNISFIGMTAGGTPVYEFEYLSSPGFKFHGVMAQDVPEATIDLGGMLMVDYSKVR